MTTAAKGLGAERDAPVRLQGPTGKGAAACGWFLLAMGTLVLAGGWIFGVDSLKNVIPGTVVMKASTAFGLACLGASLLLLLDPDGGRSRRAAGRVLALLGIGVGCAFLSEYIFGWDLGIDEFPFRDEIGRAEGISHPGRLAPTTAANLVLVGLALLNLNRARAGRWRLAEILVLPVAVIATMSLIGYLYAIPAFYGPAAAAKMAVNTAACFLVVSVGVVLARPHGHLLSLVTTTAPGGILARRVMPLVVIVPLLLGWLTIRAMDAGLFGDSAATWWLTASTVAVFLILLWRVATRMNTMDDARRQAETELYRLANRDELTGLYNRRRFREEADLHAQRTRRSGAATAMIVLDLDGLKAVNDELGHRSGDTLLAGVGRALAGSIRATDSAGRLGGDEFGVLLPDTTEKGALGVAEKLLAAVREAGSRSGGASRDATASIGLAFSEEPLPDDGGAILAAADAAMYEAKRAGGDRVTCAEASSGAPAASSDAGARRGASTRAEWRSPPEQGRSTPPRIGERRGPGRSRSEAAPADKPARVPWLHRSPPLLAAATSVPAILVLIWDHFDTVSTAVVLLACVPLTLAVVQLLAASRWEQRAWAAASSSERLRGASTEAALDAVITIDGRSVVREWNPAAEATFGYSKEEAIGRDLSELIIPVADRATHRRGIAALGTAGSSQMLDTRIEVMAMHARGGTFPVELTATRIQSDPPMFTAFVRDISDVRRRSEENARLAAIVRSSEDAIISKDLDGVVTAWNRGAELLYEYSAAEAIGRPLVELTIPPDRVHEIGDISDRVVSGKPVALVTRRRTKSGQAVDISLRAFPVRNLSGEICGVSISAHDITDRRRREERDRLDRDGRLWRRRIEEALAHDQFRFLGQPVVDVESGQVHHHELLLRLDLDGETITPDKFLPHAECSELITEIDAWVVRRGIQLGRAGRVAINLSAKSLSTQGLIASIEEAMAASGTPAEHLIFEITETAAAENLAAAHELVVELTALGCGVALDDFGTGYGSFTYLKHLPVTELKIDMSFIRDLCSDEVDRRVVKSIITVAKNFEMVTVAEGVDNEKTLGLLREMGADLVQGYLLGRPEPISDGDREATSRVLEPGRARGAKH